MIKNKVEFSKLAVLLPVMLVLLSLGCGFLPNFSSKLEATPTRTPMPTFTPTSAGVVFISSTATPMATTQQQENGAENADNTGTAEDSPTPTVPPTNTPKPEPTDTPVPKEASITLIQNMNVRGGPGTNYPIIGPGPVGSSSKVVGRNADSSWLQVQYPPGTASTGWVYAPLVKVNGNPKTVAVVKVAAPPAAAPPPPQEAAPPAAPPPPKYQFTPTGWHASENAGIVHFKGRIKDEGGNLVNGFTVILNNGSWSVLAHPSGASHWYPEKGDGEWDVVLPDVSTGIGWWTLAVASYDCPNFFGGFDAQCKQYTILSEEVKIEVVYPKETIINADWVCHWDCNKGLYVQGFIKK